MLDLSGWLAGSEFMGAFASGLSTLLTALVSYIFAMLFGGMPSS